MKHITIPLAIAVLLLFALVAFAQSGGDYELSWSTVDGGGATSAGGSYALSGAIGQPDAGVLTGSTYELTGGLWGYKVQVKVYLPVTLRNYGP